MSVEDLPAHKVTVTHSLTWRLILINCEKAPGMVILKYFFGID